MGEPAASKRHAAAAPRAELPSARPQARAAAPTWSDERPSLPARTPTQQPPTELSPQPTAERGTIYLCKAYNGGTFWASTHCNQHQALIERIASVPGQLPFDQQVAIASQQQRAAQQLVATPHTGGTHQYAAAAVKSRCAALEEEIRRIDAEARQPHSAQYQDWLRAQRKERRDEQFRIPC